MTRPKKVAKKARPTKASTVDTKLKADAEALFHPVEKNPYYFNGKPLQNLQDLVDYLPAFTGTEGRWVASWIEYLGSERIADEIREDPDNFKQIVSERCEELKKYM